MRTHAASQADPMEVGEGEARPWQDPKEIPR